MVGFGLKQAPVNRSEISTENPGYPVLMLKVGRTIRYLIRVNLDGEFLSAKSVGTLRSVSIEEISAYLKVEPNILRERLRTASKGVRL